MIKRQVNSEIPSSPLNNMSKPHKQQVTEMYKGNTEFWGRIPDVLSLTLMCDLDLCTCIVSKLPSFLVPTSMNKVNLILKATHNSKAESKMFYL